MKKGGTIIAWAVRANIMSLGKILVVREQKIGKIQSNRTSYPKLITVAAEICQCLRETSEL